MKHIGVALGLIASLGVGTVHAAGDSPRAPAGVLAVYHTMMGRTLPCLALEPQFVPVTNGLSGPQTVIPSGVSNFTTTKQLVAGATLSDAIQRRCKLAMPLRAPRANGDSRPIPGLYKLPPGVLPQGNPHILEIAFNAYVHDAWVLSTGLWRGRDITPPLTLPALHAQLKVTLRTYGQARRALRAFRLYWAIAS